MTYEELLHKAASFCSLQERCKFDVKEKLQKLDASEEQITKILNRLIDEKFINEERYALAYVKDKFRFNKWGKIKIQMGLKEKKIHSEIIYTALDSIDDDEYFRTAKELIQSKSNGLKYKNEFDRKGKLARYLLQKGFESSIVFKIIPDDNQIHEA